MATLDSLIGGNQAQAAAERRRRVRPAGISGSISALGRFTTGAAAAGACFETGAAGVADGEDDGDAGITRLGA